MMFILIGGGFAIFGGWQLYATRSFLSSATQVQAQVIDSHENCDNDGCTWWPEFTVTDATGAQVMLQTQFGSSAYQMSEGEIVTVHVNPDFDYVRIPGTSNLWLLGAAFFALGFPTALLGVWLMVRHTRIRRD